MRTRTLPALAPREMCSAVLTMTGTGYTNWNDREGEWLLGQLSRAAKQSIHLASVVRELHAEFPRLTNALAVVDRLLDSEAAAVTLVWRRTSDGARVYVGYPAQEPALPPGQAWYLPGLNFNDWYYNGRPRRPVPAGAV